MDKDKIRPGAPRALIAGATGLSGRYAARLFRSKGWHVTTLSRGTPGDTESDRHVAADLMDPAAVVTALAGLTDITHVFLCIWSMQANEAENVRVNKAMLVNLFAGLPTGPLRHIALVTGLKHYLGPFEAYASGKPYTPFLESQPRLPGLNFYYDQEDVVFAEAQHRNVTWSVHRPHTMIGVALGNAMNMGVTLAIYASICKATGRPFVFPGSTEQYNATIDVTDAAILAEQLHWAVSTPEAANMPFNIVNGDVFRWTWLWAQIADYFGLAVAPHPGRPTPLVAQMKDAGPVWSRLVEAHDLQAWDISKLASWWHSDADLGRTMECFTDMTNSRTRGFTSYSSTRESFYRVFDELRKTRIIP